MGRAMHGCCLVFGFWRSMLLLSIYYGVQASPRCTNEVSDVTAVVGTTVLLPCLLDKKFGFKWRKQANQSLLTLHHTPRFVQSRQGLVIQNVKKEDEGKYQVEVDGEGVVVFAAVNLHVKALIESASSDVSVMNVREGETTALHCGHPPTEGQSTVRWVNGVGIGIGITGNDVINRYSSLSNGTLVVSPVTRGDSGEYVCVRTITTQQGSYETSVKWFLDVLYGAVIIDMDESIIAQEDMEVLMKCVSIGNPTPATTWSLPNTNTTYNNNNNNNNNSRVNEITNDTFTVFTNGSLVLWKVRRSEEGKYNCSAYNGVGNPDVRTTHLQVMYGPEFSIALPFFNTKAVKEGEKVIFDCSSTANPPPRISWSRDDVKLTSTDGKYTVHNARLNDSGVYVCRVASGRNQVNRTFNITVKGRPWTPRSLKVSMSTDRVRFSWTPEPSGGLETTFELWFRPKSQTDMDWNLVTSHDDVITMKSGAVMTSDEREIYCSVRSVNSEGVSEFSPVVKLSSDGTTETMGMLADAPLTPTNLTLDYSRDGFYTLQWMYTHTPGRPPATNFQIEYRDDTNTTKWIPYHQPSRSRRGMVSTRVVGDLVKKEIYLDDTEVAMFRVFAVAENGKRSPPASCSTKDMTVMEGSRIDIEETDIIPPLILGIIFVFFFIILLVSLYCFCRRKKRKPPARNNDAAVKNKSDLIVETHSMEFDDECKLFAPKATALPFLAKPSPYTVKTTTPDSPALFHLPLCPALQLGKCSKRNGDSGLDNGGVRHSDVRNTDDVYFLLEAHPKERATCTCGDVTHVSFEGSGNTKSSPSTPQDSAPSSPPSSHGAHACDEFSDDYNSDEMNKLCVNELNKVRKQVLNRFNFKDSYDQFCAPGDPDCPPPSYRGHTIPYKELSVVEKTEADKNMDDNHSEDSVPESERRLETKHGTMKVPQQQPHLKSQPPPQYNPNTKFYDIKSIDKFEECNSTSSDPDSISFLRTAKNNSNSNMNKSNANNNAHRHSLKSRRDNGYCSDSPAFTDSGIHEQPRRSITPSQGFNVYSDDESFTRLSPSKGHRSKRPPTYNQAIIDIERMSERNDVTDSEEMFDKLILMEQQLGVQLSDSLDSQINMPVPHHSLSTTLPGKYRQPHSKNSSDTGYISDVPLGSDATTRYSNREKSVRCAQLLTEFRSSKPDGMQLLDSSEHYSDHHSSHNNTSNSMEDDSTELTTLRTHSSASNATPHNEWLV